MVGSPNIAPVCSLYLVDSPEDASVFVSECVEGIRIIVDGYARTAINTDSFAVCVRKTDDSKIVVTTFNLTTGTTVDRFVRLSVHDLETEYPSLGLAFIASE